MQYPEQYPRRILLCVTGMSPQVVTETLYALHLRKIPFVPTEIHVISTLKGANLAKTSLLALQIGQFFQLCRDYPLGDIAFPAENIHVIQNTAGEPLEDIRNPDDNEAAANSICRLVAKLTADSNAALHVSIAGGRKSMGFYIGYALSLFGRVQDRLSHVLIGEDYENHPEFFYPTKAEKIITTKQGKKIDARAAELTLADIPFVRMRLGIPPALENGEFTFGQAVRFVESALLSPTVEIDYEEKRIKCAGRVIEMGAREAALYVWLAKRCVESNGGESALVAYDTDDYRDYLAIYEHFASSAHYLNMAAKLEREGGFTLAFFNEIKTLANKGFEKVMGRLSLPYEIILTNPRARVAGDNPCGLRLLPTEITFRRVPRDFFPSVK